MAKVIIFGIAENSSLAHYYLNHDTEHEVVAFTVNRDYLPDDLIFEGLPVLPFEEVERSHPPTEFSMFAPLAASRMNRFREQVYTEIKAKNYQLISYVSSKATVFPGAIIGDNCFILEDNTIQPYVKIGNNVVLWSGNHIGHHGEIRDHVYFTSHVVLSGRCLVEPYCYFAVNCTIRDGLHIAEGTFVTMASSVTRDTEPWGVYKGSPAQKTKISSQDYYK